MERNDIQILKLWFVDILGKLKSISVSYREFEYALTEGMGLDGIKHKMAIPPITEENIFDMAKEERAAHKIDTLPAYLYEAINYTRNSELVKKILGEHTFEKFIANKDIEWDNYRTHISSYEIEHYLSTL